MPTITIKHLDEKVYKDPKFIISVSFSVRKRHPAFSGEAGKLAASALQKYLKTHAIKAFGWVIMPDRILLTASPTEKKSMFDIVKELKAILQAVVPSADFWPDFFDHVLRKSEDPLQEVLESFARVVQGGLVSEWTDYPHLGSTEYNLSEISAVPVVAEPELVTV